MKIVRVHSHPSSQSMIPTSPWCGGGNLRSEKVIFSSLEKPWIKKYHSRICNHLSMPFTFILPSIIGISKLTCTLKGVTLIEWLLEVDVLHVASLQRIWAKLSIIMFLYHSRASSSNYLKESSSPHLFFLPTREVVRVCKVGLAKVQPFLALTPYTLTSLRTCKEKQRKSRLL